MHPFIARIHPALRVGLMAWLISRGAAWLLHGGKGLEVSNGAPLPGLVSSGLERAAMGFDAQWAIAAVNWTPWIALEALMLAAGVAVYRFVRTTELPQVAERACWLWFFNPLVVFHIANWGTQMAIAAGTLALAALVTRKAPLFSLAAIIALGCRLEFALVWPAVAIASWQHYGGGNQGQSRFLLGALTIPVAFVAWIAATLQLTGSVDTSMRALHGGLAWRQGEALIPIFPSEWWILIAALGGVLLSLRYLRRFPSWYVLCAVPLLCWPLLQVPAHLAAVVLAWSLPSFAHLAVVTDERGMERNLLAAFIVAYLLVMQTAM